MEFKPEPPLKHRFNNNISSEEAARGIEVTILNAKELLDDATFLFNNKRYARALSLAILSIEEVGKVELIKGLLVCQQKVATLWRNVRDHKSKSFIWQVPLLQSLNVTSRGSLAEILHREGNAASYIDDLKQLGFYSEGLKVAAEKACEWKLPSVMIDRTIASQFISLAKTIVFDDRIIWTKEALEIFKQFARFDGKQVVYTDLPGYYNELQAKGIISQERLRRIVTNLSKLS